MSGCSGVGYGEGVGDGEGVEVAVGTAVGGEVGSPVAAFVGEGPVVGVGVKVCCFAGCAAIGVDRGWSASRTAPQDVSNRARISSRDRPQVATILPRRPEFDLLSGRRTFDKLSTGSRRKT